MLTYLIGIGYWLNEMPEMRREYVICLILSPVVIPIIFGSILSRIDVRL
jgi:hypothetical protein